MGKIFVQYVFFIGILGFISFYLSWRFFSWIGKKSNKEVSKIKKEMRKK